jgi:hypothetical protein
VQLVQRVHHLQSQDQLDQQVQQVIQDRRVQLVQRVHHLLLQARRVIQDQQVQLVLQVDPWDQQVQLDQLVQTEHKDKEQVSLINLQQALA